MNEVVIIFCMRLSTNVSFNLENINQLYNASTWCITFTLKQLLVNVMATNEFIQSWCLSDMLNLRPFYELFLVMNDIVFDDNMNKHLRFIFVSQLDNIHKSNTSGNEFRFIAIYSSLSFYEYNVIMKILYGLELFQRYAKVLVVFWRNHIS